MNLPGVDCRKHNCSLANLCMSDIFQRHNWALRMPSAETHMRGDVKLQNEPLVVPFEL